MVFAVLVCGQISSTGHLANIELRFPSCPRPVALGRAAQQALADEEAAITGQVRHDKSGYLMVYDDIAQNWVPLHNDSQIKQYDQVYFAHRADARLPLITELPEPRSPVTEAARREPAGGWMPGRLAAAQLTHGPLVMHNEDPNAPPRMPHHMTAPLAISGGQMIVSPEHALREGPAVVPVHPKGTVSVEHNESAVRVAIVEILGLEPEALPQGRAVQAEVSIEGYEPLVTLPSCTGYWNEAFDFSPAPNVAEVLLRIAIHSIWQPQMTRDGPLQRVPEGPPSGAPVGGVEVSLRTSSFINDTRRLRLPVLRGTTGQEVATIVVEVSALHGPGSAAP